MRKQRTWPNYQSTDRKSRVFCWQDQKYRMWLSTKEPFLPKLFNEDVVPIRNIVSGWVWVSLFKKSEIFIPSCTFVLQFTAQLCSETHLMCLLKSTRKNNRYNSVMCRGELIGRRNYQGSSLEKKYTCTVTGGVPAHLKVDTCFILDALHFLKKFSSSFFGPPSPAEQSPIPIAQRL